MTAAPLTKRKEADIKSAILLFLRAHGIACWLTGVGAYRATHNGRERFIRLGTKGMSDIVGILPGSRSVRGVTGLAGLSVTTNEVGRALFIEVKTPTGKIRPEQTAFLQTVVKAGGIGFVARSVDDVRAKLGL